MSVHDPPRLCFEPLKLLNFDFYADPDPVFHYNAQCRGYGSGSEFGSGYDGVPGSGFGFTIQIRIQEGQNGPEKYKTISKFHLLKCRMFSLEG